MLLNSQQAQIAAGSSKPAASFQVRRFFSRGVAGTNPLREKENPLDLFYAKREIIKIPTEVQGI